MEVGKILISFTPVLFQWKITVQCSEIYAEVEIGALYVSSETRKQQGFFAWEEVFIDYRPQVTC